LDALLQYYLIKSNTGGDNFDANIGGMFYSMAILVLVSCGHETGQRDYDNVEAKRRANNKLHDVWKLSFDWKYCNSLHFIKQKLNYMHDNPCTGK